MESQRLHVPTFSFEFFPPKTAEGRQKLLKVHSELAALKPRFFSVTFGAGGSTRDRTLETIADIKSAGSDAAPHISCVASSKTEIAELLIHYQQTGIKHLVALRGDMPSGDPARGEFNHANELVEFIRKTTGKDFFIEIAAYPETHPQAHSTEKDLQNFKRKADAGADSAITQYFYNPDSYFYFVERCEKMGINLPIVPGIMPITNYTRLARFSDACGAEIPRWIRKQLEAYGDDEAAIRDFGTEVVTNLCHTLLEAGAPGLHFYTMNQTEPTLALWKNLGL
ncbi:MAG: methylenetetrahydrofolate reductase [NAD(P)H] [Gammaproteobacteria bacterium]|nr:methylenetetrahydrofolate reductase [NAD(P)H] [Gammaproteobacteria bacterium]